ncbi:(2Fe-2S)-binding protein [Bacillus sp. sid0103]|uniref:2Fe-2S iron-sulfur cluster-binding protein n=1 Tax=Bacillus sp. sid0103 TaxID=2856337 RepID=UPI001C4690C2|nr:2Fe-2S iron-sulfur cluster-binding protein [Bacillus sp. sid0103]MBV7505833.1 (2Fe-2S)-binding protein [Bacillus sp. sid0103]
MNNRVFTVGSLLPGKMAPVRNSPAHTVVEKREAKHQSGKVITHLEKIFVIQGRNQFEIAPAKGTLLDAALKQGQAIKYKCQKGTCGQCTVQVLQGPSLSKPNEQEHKKLGDELNNGYRLACQAVIL